MTVRRNVFSIKRRIATNSKETFKLSKTYVEMSFPLKEGLRQKETTFVADTIC